MATWRINLKPGAQSGINARQHCLTKNVVGIGWQVEYKDQPLTADFYENKAIEVYYNDGDKSWWPAWNALYHKMEIDDLIWTRDRDGVYYLGRITSAWFYDTSKEASQADIVNVRKCDWKKIGTIGTVPGKLVNCFIPARTLQQVNDETVNLFSQLTYNEKSNTKYYQPAPLAGKDVFSLLSSDDCEDALALYLQMTKNYMVIPSSCKSDTMSYEYELVHRMTKEKAVVQVKNGIVNLNTDDYQNIEGNIFLFTTKGEYYGQEYNNVCCVKAEEIKHFLYDNINILPNKMKIWVELTRTINGN